MSRPNTRHIALAVAAALALSAGVLAQQPNSPTSGPVGTPGANPAPAGKDSTRGSTANDSTVNGTESGDAVASHSSAAPGTSTGTSTGTATGTATGTDKGAAAPGTMNPAATDPATATPGTVSQGPPAPGNEASAARQADRERSGRERLAEAGPAKGPASVTAGMPVQSGQGEPIGTVRDVVPNQLGDPGYVLITTPKGGRTAVPYSTAAPTIHRGTIVLDRSRLEHAPQVKDSELQDPNNTRWQLEADRYWSEQNSTR